MNWDKQTLHPDDITFLNEATTKTDLRKRVVHLREQGFTVRDIAQAINRPPSTVQYWSREARVMPPPPRLVVMTRPVEIEPAVAELLKEQAKKARRANRHTQPGTAEHHASEDFTRTLKFLAKERLVPVKTLAEAAGISSAAISQRIK